MKMRIVTAILVKLKCDQCHAEVWHAWWPGTPPQCLFCRSVEPVLQGVK